MCRALSKWLHLPRFPAKQPLAVTATSGSVFSNRHTQGFGMWPPSPRLSGLWGTEVLPGLAWAPGSEKSRKTLPMELNPPHRLRDGSRLPPPGVLLVAALTREGGGEWLVLPWPPSALPVTLQQHGLDQKGGAGWGPCAPPTQLLLLSSQ